MLIKYKHTNITNPFIGLLIIALLSIAKIINKGITKDFGIWKTLPEKVGKLLTIAIDIKPIHKAIISKDFKLYDIKNSSMAMGNNIKKAAAGVGTPVK